MSIGIHHLKLVAAIVKEGTLTKAADTLHLTQSALSHQLKELENELRTAIFYRKGRKLLLSDAGKRFLNSADKILAELRLLEEDLKNVKDGETGTLHITTQCYTAYHWLPRIIKYYKKVSPNININIVSTATHRPLEYLQSGDLDVAIVRNKIGSTQIHYEPIFEDQLFAILSTQHPLAAKRNIRIGDLKNEELYLPFNDANSGTIPVIENLMKQEGIQPRHVHRIHYTDAIIEMINSNLGIGVLADWIIKPYLETKAIVARPLPPEVANRIWYAATCKQNTAIKNFCDCLKQHFSDMTMKITERAISDSVYTTLSV